MHLLQHLNFVCTGCNTAVTKKGQKQKNVESTGFKPLLDVQERDLKLRNGANGVIIMQRFAFRIDPSWSRFQASLTVDWLSATNLSGDASQKPPKGHLY